MDTKANKTAANALDLNMFKNPVGNVLRTLCLRKTEKLRLKRDAQKKHSSLLRKSNRLEPD
jgi:hypothetical protein